MTDALLLVCILILFHFRSLFKNHGKNVLLNVKHYYRQDDKTQLHAHLSSLFAEFCSLLSHLSACDSLSEPITNCMSGIKPNGEQFSERESESARAEVDLPVLCCSCS